MMSSLTGCGTSSQNGSAAANSEPTAETTPSASADTATADLGSKKIGVCIYDFADFFMSSFRRELENYLISRGFDLANITIADGANDHETQMKDIQSLIDEGVDVLVVNPVMTSEAPAITDMVVKAGIPLVYINREPDADEEARWKENGWNVTYVGCDARQTGTMQGRIIADLGLDAVDFNGNGKVDYIMIKGDPENIDAKYRTEFSIKALTDAGMDTVCLSEQEGNWDQTLAQQLVENALGQYGENIEVVFCNNDEMALGALVALTDAGRTVGKDVYLLGVDALPEACEEIIAGKMTGTVFNDYIAQSHNSADAAINFLNGSGNEYYISADSIMVTKDNAQSILDFQG